MKDDSMVKTDTYSITGMLVNLVGTTAVLFIGSAACRAAAQDGWMSPLIATLYGFYVVYIVYRLGSLYPGQAFIEYLPLILGKAAGKIVGFIYIVFLFYLTSSVLREALALFYGTGAYTLTPSIVLALLLIIAMTYAVFSGIEVISRSLSLYWLIIGIVFTITILLAVPYMKMASLLPIGEAGLGHIFKGTIVPLAYYGELFILAMLLPYLKNPRAGLVAGTAASMLITFFMTIMTIATITVLGVETTTRSLYALFFLNDFIPPIGMKVFLVSLWVVAFWGKLMILQFVTCDGISQLLELKSYRYIVLPVAALILVFSYEFYENVPDMLVSIPQTFPGVALFFEYLIPTLLLIIALIKTKAGLKP